MEENFKNFSENTSENHNLEQTSPEASEIPEQSQQEDRENDEKKSMGPIVGIAIIVILIIYGGLYYWGGKIKNQDQKSATAEEILNQEDGSLDLLRTQRPSDEIADIEADLDSTNLEGLDKELDDIDAELGL